jgi:hypothetical protein
MLKYRNSGPPEMIVEKTVSFKWFRRFVKAGLYMGALTLALYGFVFVALKTTDYYNSVVQIYDLKRIQIKQWSANYFGSVHYQTASLSMTGEEINALIEVYSKKYKLSPVIAKAIILRESGGPNTSSGYDSKPFRTDRLRFEPSWKADYSKKIKKDPWMNDVEYDMYFTSIGLMQIGYGIWKDFCSINTYSDLLNPDINIECGIKIVRACIDRQQSIKPFGRRLRYCFREYNGSGEKAERYADAVMATLVDFIIDEKSIIEGNVSVASDDKTVESTAPEKTNVVSRVPASRENEDGQSQTVVHNISCKSPQGRSRNCNIIESEDGTLLIQPLKETKRETKSMNKKS